MFIAGAIIIQHIGLSNYFKKKTFTANIQQQKKLNNIKIDKLRKELKLEYKKQDQDITGTLTDLAGKFLTNKDDDDQEGILDSIGSGILEYAKENPELVQKFFNKITPEDKESNKGY